MKKSTGQRAIDIAAVQSRMITIRSQQVLLDRDVAALYGVETKALNQAVKRNAEKFPEGYILKMTDEECSRSQIVTLNGGRGSNLKSKLTEAIIEKRPRIVFCGHIHTGQHGGVDFLKSRVYNVSRLDERYEIAYEPTWVDV